MCLLMKHDLHVLESHCVNPHIAHQSSHQYPHFLMFVQLMDQVPFISTSWLHKHPNLGEVSQCVVLVKYKSH